MDVSDIVEQPTDIVEQALDVVQHNSPSLWLIVGIALFVLAVIAVVVVLLTRKGRAAVVQNNAAIPYMPVEAGRIYCSQCGQQISSDSAFCEKCGAKLL